MPQSESAVTLSRADAQVAMTAKQQPRSAHATVLSGSLIMLISMMLVNVFNFAYNIVMARILGPGEFGHINAAVTMLLLASCISLAFQLVCTKFVPRNTPAEGKAAVVPALLAKACIPTLLLGSPPII